MRGLMARPGGPLRVVRDALPVLVVVLLAVTVMEAGDVTAVPRFRLRESTFARFVLSVRRIVGNVADSRLGLGTSEAFRALLLGRLVRFRVRSWPGLGRAAVRTTLFFRGLMWDVGAVGAQARLREPVRARLLLDDRRLRRRPGRVGAWTGLGRREAVRLGFVLDMESC